MKERTIYSNLAIRFINILIFVGAALFDSIAAPCNFSVAIAKQDVDCYSNATGQATVNITGPAGVYEYSWSNGDSTATASNLTAETYFVKVNNEEGCEILDFIEINQPPKLQSEAVINDVKCYGEPSGQIHLITTGGKGSYNYLWSNGSESSFADSLYAGDYIAEVTDENFCTWSDTFSVKQPAVLNQSVTIRDVSGYKLSNGTINIDVQGGKKPYRYQWYYENSLYDTIEDIKNLTAGIYSLNVTDNNLCSLLTNIEVEEPDTLQATMLIQDVDCSKGTSGSIDITVTGGVPPYSYVWSNSEIVIETSGEDISQLPSDHYYVSITDVNGNKFEDSAFVDEPIPLLVNFNVQNVTCYGGSDGNVLVTVSGGSPDYAYQWSDNSDQQDLMNVLAGNYHLQIVDKNGCTFNGNITIDQPGPFVIEQDISPITCKDDTDGKIALSLEGNTAPYAVSWQSGQQQFTIDSLEAGIYVAYITDANMCDTSLTITLVNPANGCISIPNAFTPNNDDYNDTWIIDNAWLYPEIEIKVYNTQGYIVYEGNVHSDPWDGKYNGRDVSSGTYFYTLSLNNGDAPFKGSVTIVR